MRKENGRRTMRWVRTWIVVASITLSTLSAQSLWRDRRSLISDPTARQVGDILTVVIQQRETINQDDRTRTERNTENSFKVNSFNVAPNAFGSPLPDLDVASRREFDTRGQLQRDGEFTTTLSVVVIDTLPNGNMVIRGRQTVTIDGDRKTIELTGIVRRQDVRSDNTALSNRVANANIKYVSEGTLSRATTKGPIAEAIDWVWWVVWPF